MTPLFIFGICVAIAIALVLLFMIIFGGNSLLLIIIFPALLAEQITGERGLDFGRKSFFYLIFLWIFILTEIILIASVFFGLYCLFFGYPIGVASTEGFQITTSDINQMLVINKILLVIVGYFIIQFIYSSVKYKERFKQFDTFQFILYRVFPIITLPIAIVYLWSFHTYLLAYPNAEPVQTTIIILSYVYVIKLLYFFIKSIIGYVRLFNHGIRSMPLNFWFSNAIGLLYDCLFVYFFYQINIVFKL